MKVLQSSCLANSLNSAIENWGPLCLTTDDIPNGKDFCMTCVLVVEGRCNISMNLESTDELTISLHFTSPRCPSWIFYGISPLIDLGITILPSLSMWPLCSDNSDFTLAYPLASKGTPLTQSGPWVFKRYATDSSWMSFQDHTVLLVWTSWASWGDTGTLEVHCPDCRC